MAADDTSYYRASATAQERAPRLQGKRSSAVCIIGGGFAGLNAALGLAECGVRSPPT